jgi:hypothetical protein
MQRIKQMIHALKPQALFLLIHYLHPVELCLTPPFSNNSIFVRMDSLPHNHRMARTDGYQAPISRSTACSQMLLGGLHTQVRHHPAKY